MHLLPIVLVDIRAANCAFESIGIHNMPAQALLTYCCVLPLSSVLLLTYGTGTRTAKGNYSIASGVLCMSLEPSTRPPS